MTLRVRPDGGRDEDQDADDDDAPPRQSSLDADTFKRRDFAKKYVPERATSPLDDDAEMYGLTLRERQTLKRAMLDDDLERVLDVLGADESMRTTIRDFLADVEYGQVRAFTSMPYTAVDAEDYGHRFDSRWYEDFSFGVGEKLGSRWNDLAKIMARGYGKPGTSSWLLSDPRRDGLDPSEPFFDDLRRAEDQSGKSYQARFGSSDRALTPGEKAVREAIEQGEPQTDRPLRDERREWSGSQDRSDADKHFYAVHFEGRVPVATSNKLLNEFQSAGRVLWHARNNPSALTKYSGISSRTVEKLAALDPDETILTPTERQARSEAERREQREEAERRQRRRAARRHETLGGFETGDVRRTVALVGCGGQKQDTAAPARSLYTSNYFQLKREFAETFADKWYVLSAEHGLVEPDEVLEPYDTTLKSMTSYHRERWADDVQQALPDLSDARVIALAGADYLEPLRGLLENEAADLRTPLAGMGIGSQMGFMRDELDAFDGEGTPQFLQMADVPTAVNGWELTETSRTRYEWLAPGSENFGGDARDGIEAIGAGNRWYVRTFTARPKRQQSLSSLGGDPDLERSSYTNLRLRERTRDGAVERAVSWMEGVAAPGSDAA